MTITSMQFGQSAISVVLNEGQLPAKLTTDANGNTVLVGADGVEYAALPLDENGNPVGISNYFDVRTYGAKCDGQAIFDGVVSAVGGGIYQLVSATANFKSTDVGLKGGITKLATGVNYGYDTVITSWISASTIQFSSGATPASTTGYMYVWGTDDAVAVQAAFNAAAASGSRGTVFFPGGITCLASSVTAPNGISLRGVGSNSMMDQLYAMRPSGSYIAAIDAFANYVINLGATLAGGGVMVYDLSVDAMNMNAGGLQDISKGNTRKNVACLRGTYKTIISAGSSVMESCVLAGQQRGTVLRQTGDSRVINNYIFGAQASTGSTLFVDWWPTVELQGSDMQFCNNHLWRDGGTQPAGDLVLVKCDGGVKDGEIIISQNNFDTPVGACVYVKVTGVGTVLRTLNISLNSSITNNLVQDQPSATLSGSITSNVLTVASVSAGTVYTGARLSGGTVGNGVYVGEQLSGTPGGAGTYTCIGGDATGITSAIGYPYIILDVAAGCTIKALNITGNTGFGSWDIPTKSPYACFIDGSRMLGTILVANINSNVLDNCGAGYSNLKQGIGTVTGGTVTVLNSTDNYCIPNIDATTAGTTPVSF